MATMYQNNQCFACGNCNLLPCLDLGHQPPANNLRTSKTQDEPSYPLNVIRCVNCNHLQLDVTVSPDVLYKNYLYVSGTSKTYLEYMNWYARFVFETFSETNGVIPNSILDIGCNDGSQLDSFKNIIGCLKIDTYGVDPAINLYPISSAKHKVSLGYWSADNPITFRQYDVITSQNAFSHIPDPLTYLKLVNESLTDNGLMFISTSQADMVLNGEFDTVYHEHISYYNSYSMKCLAERAGLFLVDVIKTPIHGISYIFVLSKREFNYEKVSNILSLEKYQGLQSAATYNKWATRAKTIIEQTKDVVDSYRESGYKIIGYGAAAKGMTFITAANIECDVIIDDNPLKQGRFVPGLPTQIVDSSYLSDKLLPSDQVLFIPLAWNFFSEIKSNILDKRTNSKDVFLRYFPQVEILE